MARWSKSRINRWLLARRYGRSIVPNRSAPEARVAGVTNSRTALRRRRLRVGGGRWGQCLYQNGRSIVPNRSAPEATAACKANGRTAVRRRRLRVEGEPLGTMALHWKTPPLARRGGAIGDNVSTRIGRVLPLESMLIPRRKLRRLGNRYSSHMVY